MPVQLIDSSNYGPFEARQFFFGPASRTGLLVAVDTALPLGNRPILEVELLGAESLFRPGGRNLPVYEFWARQYRSLYYYDVRTYADAQCRVTRVDSFGVPTIAISVWRGRP